MAPLYRPRRPLTLVLLLAATGCVVVHDGWDSSSSTDSGSSTWEPPPPAVGDVEVGWQLGSAGCEAGGVVDVEITLGTLVTTAPCADELAVVVAPAGWADLVLRGLDADGVARYEGSGGEVRVHAGELVTAPTVLLSALPASIQASWFFENGRLCASNGVVDVEASLFDANDVLRASEIDACEASELRLGEVQAGPYVLLVLGRDDVGEAVFRGEAVIEAGRGDRIAVDVMLQPEG
jgi:hypothetical protein